MATIINKTREHQAQLTREGRVKEMTSPEDIALATKINNKVMKVHRDYLLKSRLSQISAAQMILTS